jgi:ribonucleotide monophosphatase NagD (HAD superfamily)
MYKTYVFDIDGTVCSNTFGEYDQAIPFRDRISVINKLYDEGHKIVFLTARGMGRHNNDASLAIEQFYKMTKEQLDSWGLRYHDLYLGKPQGDIYVDDKGSADIDFFRDKVMEA